MSQHELKLVFLSIHLTIYHSGFFLTFDIEITLSSQNWFRSDVCNSMILLSDDLIKSRVDRTNLTCLDLM